MSERRSVLFDTDAAAAATTTTTTNEMLYEHCYIHIHRLRARALFHKVLILHITFLHITVEAASWA